VSSTAWKGDKKIKGEHPKKKGDWDYEKVRRKKTQ
jgi:hypothetical protein